MSIRKKLGLLVVIIMLAQLFIPIICHAENLVSIRFQDKNLYDDILVRLPSIIAEHDDTTLSVKITQENLNNITSLSLSNNIEKLNGLENFTNLTSLSLISNNISDISPLASIKKLTTLMLYHNNINDVSPLAYLTNLTDLNLSNNSINNVGPLNALTNLTNLDLSYNEITDISCLTNLVNLTELHLNSNSIDNINVLDKYTKLTKLYLYENNINIISPLKNLSSLEVLWLYKNAINDVSALENMNINELYLNNQTLSVITNTRLVNLPKVFIQAQDEESIAYTNKDFILTNCVLNENKASLTIDNNASTANIQINSGKLNGTVLTYTVDDTRPELKLNYSSLDKTDKDVVVTITANEKIQPVDGWTISEDAMSIFKAYSSNIEEVVTVYDLAGNSSSVSVKITNIDKTPKEDNTTSQNILPYTGIGYIIFYIILILIIGIILYKKYKNLQDIK